jgi:hypothetical protein
MVLLILKCNLKYIEKKKNINNTLKKKGVLCQLNTWENGSYFVSN